MTFRCRKRVDRDCRLYRVKEQLCKKNLALLLGYRNSRKITCGYGAENADETN